MRYPFPNRYQPNLGAVFVISNRKGGCGKSFTTASLGVGLARQAKKVLCIDTDNQHSLTVSLGVTEPDKLPVTLKTIISDIIDENEIDPTADIIHHAEGIDLMPANNSNKRGGLYLPFFTGSLVNGSVNSLSDI